MSSLEVLSPRASADREHRAPPLVGCRIRSGRHPHPASEERKETALSASLDRPVRVGTGQWQNTPVQRSSRDIDEKVKEYADRLARLHAAQVRLYHALLWTDEAAAEFAAADVRAAINALPGMPDWPDTDEELIARLRGKFVLAQSERPETSRDQATEHHATARMPQTWQLSHATP